MAACILHLYGASMRCRTYSWYATRKWFANSNNPIFVRCVFKTTLSLYFSHFCGWSDLLCIALGFDCLRLDITVTSTHWLPVESSPYAAQLQFAYPSTFSYPVFVYTLIVSLLSVGNYYKHSKHTLTNTLALIYLYSAVYYASLKTNYFDIWNICDVCFRRDLRYRNACNAACMFTNTHSLYISQGSHSWINWPHGECPLIRRLSRSSVA